MWCSSACRISRGRRGREAATGAAFGRSLAGAPALAGCAARVAGASARAPGREGVEGPGGRRQWAPMLAPRSLPLSAIFVQISPCRASVLRLERTHHDATLYIEVSVSTLSAFQRLTLQGRPGYRPGVGVVRISTPPALFENPGWSVEVWKRCGEALWGRWKWAIAISPKCEVLTFQEFWVRGSRGVEKWVKYAWAKAGFQRPLPQTLAR